MVRLKTIQRNKKILFGVIALLFIVTGVLYVKPSARDIPLPSAPWKTYSDYYYRYSFHYPAYLTPTSDSLYVSPNNRISFQFPSEMLQSSTTGIIQEGGDTGISFGASTTNLAQCHESIGRDIDQKPFDESGTI